MLKREAAGPNGKQHLAQFRTPRENDNDAAIPETSLEGSYHELMTFFNAMDEVFFSIDIVNQRIIQISSACEKMFGYKPADFLANRRLWHQLVHPDDKHISANDNDIYQRGEQLNGQIRIVRKDKAVRWIERKITPGFDRDGKLVRVDGISRDITERKEAEEKHRQGEERYRQIVETAQEGIWTIDESEKTNFVNKKICDILGYSPDEMMGKGLYDFMDEEGRAYAIECMERRRKGVKENLDIRYVTKSGENVWANISANPIFDNVGKYKGSLAMVTDITQRKLDEVSLKKSEANLRAIFDNTDAAYVLFDDQQRIISFNAQAQRYSEEQNGKLLEVNRTMKDYFSVERWPEIKKILNKVTRSGIADYEISYTKSDGTVKWHSIRWLIVKNSENKKWGFILANTDITEAKIAALEREKITADLIQHNKDLEQFTYIISHNLRAPVANILGLSNILKDDDLEVTERKDILNRVGSSIENVDMIIRDLNLILQVRKPLNEKKEMVYFSELVESIKTSIYDSIVKENVKINCFFNEVGALFTIRTYIYSVFYNLISNSIKFRKIGVDPVINIKSRLLKDKIELRFKDNGKGIDIEKNAFHLFGLYRRFDTSVEGKGMGLFMVKTQVEAIGGSIKIKSKPEQGTEFVILLPA